MEGRPLGSLTSSDGYGRANSASYPAHTDRGDDGRAYRALLTQRRRRQGLQGLAHTAETTAGLTGPCSHSRDDGRAYRALLTQQRRRQGLQGLAHTEQDVGRVNSALNTASTDSYDGGEASWVSHI